ncbi:MAG: hypothetical protein ACE5D4_03245 [Thermodesulfobacteriota bacterium]
MRFWAQQALDRAGIDRERIAVALPSVDPSTVPVNAARRWFRAVWAKRITAVAMPWGIYLAPVRFEGSDAEVGRLIVHELTHIDQWRRLGALGWARTYLGDYLRGRRSGLTHHEAYLGIALEREAREVAARIGG